MKKIIKFIGKLPTLYWGLGMIAGNVVVATISHIPTIIWFNAIGVFIGLLGMVSKKLTK